MSGAELPFAASGCCSLLARQVADAASAAACPGISLKTQELYAVVFVCRYLDLFYSFISL